MSDELRIVIADDSAIIRIMLEQAFEKSNIKVLESVSTGEKAVEKAGALKPSLVILDDKMSSMSGLDAAKIIVRDYGIPCLIFGEGEEPELDFENSNAVIFVKKPNLSSMGSEFYGPFIDKVKIHSQVTVGDFKFKNDLANGLLKNRASILCIGASTGGPTAVLSVLQKLGPNFPMPILYSQHVEIGDDKNMAKWFAENLTDLKFSLAQNGEKTEPGHVYMAPADYHLVINKIDFDGNPVLELNQDAAVRFLRPSVDKMFFSADHFYKEKNIAVLMTGMGADGAEGCKTIKDSGGFTICEDESTCAVFGMPARAIELGGASIVLRREKIAETILALISGHQ